MSDRKAPPTIEESLRRMFAAIDRADEHLSAFFNTPVRPGTPASPPPAPGAPARPDPVRAVVDHVAWEIASKLERKRMRHERKLERLRLRQERRRIEHERRRAHHAGNPVVGIVMMAAAIFTAYMAMNGKPFWYLFLALGLFMGGAAQFGRRKELAPSASDGEKANETTANANASRAATPSKDAARADADEAKRVNEIAKQLIKELEDGPAVLRQIVEKPEETVDGLRKGYHALADRERKLRALARPEEDARLAGERATLVSKRDAASDPVAKARYDEAIRALDLQRSEHAALLTAAGRLEAERTRLRYTLEGLLAQVVRARTVHGSEAAGNDAALRQSLERLSDEVGAITEALEAVNRPEPIAPISADDPASNPSASRDRVR